MIIGAQGYTIRDFVKTEKDIEDSMKKLHDIGFKTLQVSAFGDIADERMREIADENQIEIIITHTNPDMILNETDKVISRHKTYGCKYVGIGSLPNLYRDGLEGLRRFIKDYNPVAEKLHENGLKLEYHNHAFEFEKFDGKILYDIFSEETDPELWGFIVDVFWVQYGGRCPAKQIEKLKGRIDVCHFKDMTITETTKQLMAPVMEGSLCFDEIIAACESTGVKYAMIEQDDSYGRDPFSELAISYKNLKNAGMKF